MKKLFKTMAAGIALLSMTACATAPENVAPAMVSTAGYSAMSCNALRAEAMRIDSLLQTKTAAQKQAQSNDAAMTAVSLILFWPAAFFISGGDDAGLAQAKGEANAIRAAAVQKGC